MSNDKSLNLSDIDFRKCNKHLRLWSDCIFNSSSQKGECKEKWDNSMECLKTSVNCPTLFYNYGECLKNKFDCSIEYGKLEKCLK